MKKVLFLLIFLAIFLKPAKAQTVAIINPSFETGAAVSGGAGLGGPWSTQVPIGWTRTGGNGGLWQPDTSVCGYKSIPDGSTVAWLDGSTLFQDLAVPVLGNTNYTVTVWIGHRGCQRPNSYTISLLAGSTVLCSWAGQNSDVPLNTFVPQINICATPAVPLTGNLGISISSGGVEVDFDNVSINYASLTPPAPLVTLNINTGSTAVYDDGSAILPGPVSVSQSQTPTSNVGIGTIISDAGGTLSGSITVNPNWVDANGNLNFVFGLPILPNVLVYPVPVGEFQHNSTGLTLNLILFKQGPLAVKSQTLAVTP